MVFALDGVFGDSCGFTSSVGFKQVAHRGVESVWFLSCRESRQQK